MKDVYYEVMRLLACADALTPDNNRATLNQRIERIGLPEIVSAFVHAKFGKGDLAELSNDQLTMAHNYVSSIVKVIVATPGRIQ